MINLHEFSTLSFLIENSRFEDKVYAVGGIIRDYFLNTINTIKDIDLVIDLPNGGIEFAKWMVETYPTSCKDLVIYQTYGTAKFSLFTNGKFIDIECVAPRGETYDRHSRNPICSESDLKTDCFRRDLTINSLYYNLSTFKLLDMTGKGILHIKTQRLETPTDPNITFNDDPLRMLRVIRFATKYNWKIDLATLKAIFRNSERIKIISQERVTEEFCKILTSDYPIKGLELLKSTKLLEYIIPEFVSIYDMEQNKYHNNNVWEHTLNVVKNVPPTLELRLAALFHDIGKGVTKTIENGEIHFYKHEIESDNITRDILFRMKFPNRIIRRVRMLIINHMRCKDYKDEVLVSDKVIRKLKYSLYDQLDDLLKLIHADNISHSELYCMPNQVKNIKIRLSKLEDLKPKIILPITGNDIINEFNLSPGKIIGECLILITNYYLENPNITKEECLIIIKNYLNGKTTI